MENLYLNGVGHGLNIFISDKKEDLGMININMWYREDCKEADKIDITFYPNDGQYRGNIYIGEKIVGDYTCNDSVELEKAFSQLTFNWD